MISAAAAGGGGTGGAISFFRCFDRIPLRWSRSLLRLGSVAVELLVNDEFRTDETSVRDVECFRGIRFRELDRSLRDLDKVFC